MYKTDQPNENNSQSDHVTETHHHSTLIWFLALEMIEMATERVPVHQYRIKTYTTIHFSEEYNCPKQLS